MISPGTKKTIGLLVWVSLLYITVVMTVGAIVLLPVYYPPQAPTKQCPVVPGHAVLSTSDTGDKQLCVYAKSYARGSYRVNL